MSATVPAYADPATASLRSMGRALIGLGVISIAIGMLTLQSGWLSVFLVSCGPVLALAGLNVRRLSPASWRIAMVVLPLLAVAAALEVVLWWKTLRTSLPIRLQGALFIACLIAPLAALRQLIRYRYLFEGTVGPAWIGECPVCHQSANRPGYHSTAAVRCRKCGENVVMEHVRTSQPLWTIAMRGDSPVDSDHHSE